MWDETAVDWLSRTTTPRAKALREFLNRSLAYFPLGHAKSVAKRLKHDWQAHFFEIVVGRYLQVLGATVQPEPKGTNGTRVDFRATFPDGVVSVECVSKRFNREAHEQMQRSGKLAGLIDDVGPVGWIVDIHQLPDVSSPEDFAPFLAAAEQWFRTLPRPSEDAPRPTFLFDKDSQHIELEAIPAPRMNAPVHIGPSAAFSDDSIERLKDALTDEHKRKQARGAVQPVFLAIDCPFGGPDAEDFDQALLGQTVQHLGLDLRTTGFSFNSNGLLVRDQDIPFAGVMAFLGMTMTGAAEPVLYLNPYQRWKLPPAIAGLEQREWASRIDVKPASGKASINNIGFVDYGS